MRNPIILKLQRGAHLTDEDCDELSRLTADTRQIEPRQDLIREGDRPGDVKVVLDGFACRYKLLPNGSRAIISLLLPGDFCDLHVAILGEMDHSIATLSRCTVADIPHATILDLLENHPRLARALWWGELVCESIAREWLVSTGWRDADHRAAHLFCELLMRLRVVGRATIDSCDLPLTQAELGEVLALSTVHMNRTIQHLREKDLIVLQDGRLSIPDVGRLQTFAGFTPNYLHLTKRTYGGGPEGVAEVGRD